MHTVARLTDRLLPRRHLPAVACRWTGQRGHVESWFLRLNDPDRPRALWLKITLLAPLQGAAVAEAWAIWFDAGADRAWAARKTVPIAEAALPDGESHDVACGGIQFALGRQGKARGLLERGGQTCAFDLRFSPDAGPLGVPASLFPHAWLVDGPFPRSKTLTPWPVLVFDGSITFDGETALVRNWRGMHGHNWGKEHAAEYAWGQADFGDAWVEGFTGRVKLAGRLTPPISCLVVRTGEREHRWDSLVDLWRQRAVIDERTWTVALHGPAGEVELTLDARTVPLACLAYPNPDGRTAFCFNSKLARATLKVRPRTGPPFERTSDHGGALEFLRPHPEAGLDVV